MDRIIVYPGAIPLDTDLLNTNRNAMVALHALISATLGTTTAVDGLAVTATTPASMQIVVAPGSITQYGFLDANPYGSLPADLADPLVKMANLLAPLTVTLTAPTTAGSSMIYLIEASFSETDQTPVVLPYYNAANPAMPYLGPGNSGAAQMTVRQQHVSVQVKAGTPVTSGSPTVPPLDAGWVALATVQVNATTTQVTSGMIAPAPATRFTPWKLPDLMPGYAFSGAFSSSGTFTVPSGVTRLKVTVIGAGGGGGSSSAGSVGGGGGGAGGKGIAWLSGVTPGSQIAVTIGASGVAAGPGGTSSFGSFCSAVGGSGGTSGSGSASGRGGAGGAVSGANVPLVGSYGSDAVPGIARGGDGGGPGNGRGTSGGANGTNALGFGGGGGGASGAGFSGGSGGGGLVIVEW